jgi:transposase
MAKDKTPPDALPDNIEDCHKMIRELFSRIAELEKQLSRRNRALFGKKSAKVDSTLLTGTGKAIHFQTSEELESEKKHLEIVDDKKHGGGRTHSSSLPERTIEHRLPDTELPCPCGGGTREIIGFETSTQIEYVDTLFANLKHVQFKYSCKKCQGQLVLAQKPYQPIDKGKVGPGLLAKIVHDKFVVHLPLYRQEKIFLSQDIPINRSSMCRWMKEAADLLEPIANKIQKLILKSKVIQSDATKLPVIKKGAGKTHNATIWSFVGDKNAPYIYFDFSETEHGIYPEQILSGYKNILQTDGTNKYNEIIRQGAIQVNCWAHVHCKFEDAWKEDAIAAEFPMGVIKSLFDIERVAAQLTEDERKDLRQRLAKPKLKMLETWLREKEHIALPKSKLGEAIFYTLERWAGLCRYADTGFVEISNNACERSIKPIVLGKRNWLFAGSMEGGKTATILLSIVETCKRLKINPVEYLRDVFTRLPNSPTFQIDEFIPDRWLSLKEKEI